MPTNWPQLNTDYYCPRIGTNPTQKKISVISCLLVDNLVHELALIQHKKKISVISCLLVDNLVHELATTFLTKSLRNIKTFSAI